MKRHAKMQGKYDQDMLPPFHGHSLTISWKIEQGLADNDQTINRQLKDLAGSKVFMNSLGWSA